jgi:hypothetical protein
VTTILICANASLEAELCRTLFWREDLERYVAERAEEARMLALATEPHVVVVDRELPGIESLVDALRNQTLPHAISIVALSHVAADPEDSDMMSGRVNAVLSLPAGPEWDDRLDQVLEVPARKQARYEVRFDIDTLLRQTPTAHRGVALNMSAGGILIECGDLRLHPGDDVDLSLPFPGMDVPVEGRARVVRQPDPERLGLRFEAFAGDGDERVRHFLSNLAARQSPQA